MVVGCAFVKYETKEKAVAAIEGLNGNHKMEIEKAHSADLHCVDWNPIDENFILTGRINGSYPGDDHRQQKGFIPLQNCCQNKHKNRKNTNQKGKSSSNGHQSEQEGRTPDFEGDKNPHTKCSIESIRISKKAPNLRRLARSPILRNPSYTKTKSGELLVTNTRRRLKQPSLIGGQTTKARGAVCNQEREKADISKKEKKARL
ncbi:WD40 repeat-containing protein MSI4-like protein [Tanacetum coccineum]